MGGLDWTPPVVYRSPRPRWRRYASVVASFALFALALPHSALASGPGSERVLQLINQERANAGLAPLVADPSLGTAADSYARVLAITGCWAHTCGDVPDFTQRAANAGYGDWTALGENLAAGNGSAEAIVANWMQSPEHRANILNPSFTETGVATAQGGRMGGYWVQEFGSRGAAAPAFAPVIDDSGDAPASDDGSLEPSD